MNPSVGRGDDPSAESPGRLIVISGPSGAGKSTVVRQLIEQCPLPLVLSVSATTRSPRPGEVDGKHYFFVSHDAFQDRRRAGDFLECKEVFGRGHWYGTLREQVASGLARGQWVILEIDVQGAMAILDDPSLKPITLFIQPGGLDELDRRLRSRGTEDDDAIHRRLEVAATEMNYRHRYQYEIINGRVGDAVAEICEILKSHQTQRTCSKN
ncbi:MAG: guanylate kinase [Planctomycetota bacterium]